MKSASSSMLFSAIASRRKRSPHTTPCPFLLAVPIKLLTRPHTTKKSRCCLGSPNTLASQLRRNCPPYAILKWRRTWQRWVLVSALLFYSPASKLTVYQISTEARAPIAQPSTAPRGPVSAMSNHAFRTAAEEAFLEQTPWANPQHPIHQQQMTHNPQPQVFERAPTFTTPAAQKRMVDVNAPNGSASTIPENASAANSSTNNTPFGMEQEPPHSHRQLGNTDYDPERMFGFRSLSSSPLDMRKQQPASTTAFAHHRSVPDVRADATSRRVPYEPQSARLGFFTSNRDPSPPPPPSSKSVNSIHPPNHMPGQ